MHFRGAHAQHIAHQLIRLADELHIAIFNAIVHHLHKVARAVLAHPIAAGRTVFHLGADGLEDGLHIGPRLRRTAGHHAGALERAFLAAGNAGADVIQALALHIGGAADGIREMGIAAVDDDIALFQVRDDLLDKIVHRLAGLHHQHHLARLFQIGHEFFDGIGADDVLALGAAFHKFGHFLRRAVVHRHGEALAFHIHHQVLAHYGQPDETDIRFFHGVLLLIFAFSASRAHCPPRCSSPGLHPRGARSP